MNSLFAQSLLTLRNYAMLVGGRLRNRLFRLIMPHLVHLCQGEPVVRVGSTYGGWIVPTAILRNDAICYSAGLGEDGSFDRALAEDYGCHVFIFDPTPRAIAYAASELVGIPRLLFSPVGLWSKREVLRFYAPRNPKHVSHSIVNLQGTSEYFEAACESVADAMAELNHRQVDLLKLDIEGAEYEVLGALLASGLDIRALCVEFDQPAPLSKTLQQIRNLRAAGYDLVAVEGWNFTFYRRQVQVTS